MLAVALNILSNAVVMGGEYRRGEHLLAEADVVTEATGTPVLPYGALFLRAFQGREEEVTRFSDVTMREAIAAKAGRSSSSTWPRR